MKFNVIENKNTAVKTITFAMDDKFAELLGKASRAINGIKDGVYLKADVSDLVSVVEWSMKSGQTVSWPGHCKIYLMVYPNYDWNLIVHDTLAQVIMDTQLVSTL